MPEQARQKKAPTSSADASPPKPPEIKRLRILDAAATLFADRGFARARVEEISDLAGVSKGLVYVHFPSKEALLEAVLSRALIEWGSAAQAAAAKAGENTIDCLSAVLRSSIEFADQNPILRSILAQDPRVLLPGTHDHQDELAAAYIAAIRGLLSSGIDRGDIRSKIDLDHTSSIIWLLHSSLIRELFIQGVTESRKQPDRLVEATVDLLLHGLRV